MRVTPSTKPPMHYPAKESLTPILWSVAIVLGGCSDPTIPSPRFVAGGMVGERIVTPQQTPPPKPFPKTDTTPKPKTQEIPRPEVLGGVPPLSK